VRKIVVFTLVLLISAVWLQTQAAGQTGSNPSTLQGCLSYTDGHYRLTLSDGTFRQLSLEANKLHKYVGHQVEVSGKPGVRTSDTTQQGEESSAREVPVFKVKTVKSIADTCASPAQ
jgi:hypothetical protein